MLKFNKKVPAVNMKVLVHLKNIESCNFDGILSKLV